MTAACGSADDPAPVPFRVLVAGVGNLFLTDDGFGPEVARRLAAGPLPDGVRVLDYGTRGVHLAFDLLAGWQALVIIDAIASRGAPGTVHLIEVQPTGPQQHVDAHGQDPASMLAGVRTLGGQLPPTYLLGCEVELVGDGIGLSDAVAGAVEPACRAVLELAGRLSCPAGAAVVS